MLLITHTTGCGMQRLVRARERIHPTVPSSRALMQLALQRTLRTRWSTRASEQGTGARTSTVVDFASKSRALANVRQAHSSSVYTGMSAKHAESPTKNDSLCSRNRKGSVRARAQMVCARACVCVRVRVHVCVRA